MAPGGRPPSGTTELQQGADSRNLRASLAEVVGNRRIYVPGRPPEIRRRPRSAASVYTQPRTKGLGM